MFLKEREKIFLYNANEKISISPPSANDARPLIIDETQQNKDKAATQLVDTLLNSSIVSTKISRKYLLIDKPLPDPYSLPTLPDQISVAINSNQMEKFEKLCNFRSIIIDAAFHDLKKNYNLIYPTRTQYTIVVNSILNYLGIDQNTKKADSWRESLISKYKRERQNQNDDKTVEMTLRYSKEKSGRKIKQYPQTQMSERNALKNISNMGHRSDVIEQMEEKTEIIKTDYQNNSFNDPDFKRLWFDTYEYRKDFIKENTTADIMKQFPAYTNPFTILADVKVLTGIDLGNSVTENIDSLASKINSDNKFLSDIFQKAIPIMRIAVKINLGHNKPATPQPSMVLEDDTIKIYIDWTYVCSSPSIEQSLAIIVGLYYLMNLKFHPYRTVARFLCVYLLHDKQQQSSNIRRFCKEYNIELQDQSSLSSDLPSDLPLDHLPDRLLDRLPDRLPEQTQNKATSINNYTASNNDGLTIIHKQNDSDRFRNQIHIIPSQLTLTNLRPTQKRKANQIDDSEQLIEENNPPTKKSFDTITYDSREFAFYNSIPFISVLLHLDPSSFQTFQDDSDHYKHSKMILIAAIIGT
ncbi:unnamed protein product [Rotaria socialis]|uniref:Uncharacterized protein n=1 Tax=Rotaria socialis TaxID=392032 RepID=A0A820KQB1_9BILA|nr:unnamed protein product [Rotaria socialis]CAF4477904.1 unnamed protein product [Rotaria socialis]